MKQFPTDARAAKSNMALIILYGESWGTKNFFTCCIPCTILKNQVKNQRNRIQPTMYRKNFISLAKPLSGRKLFTTSSNVPVLSPELAAIVGNPHLKWVDMSKAVSIVGFALLGIIFDLICCDIVSPLSQRKQYSKDCW